MEEPTAGLKKFLEKLLKFYQNKGNIMSNKATKSGKLKEDVYIIYECSLSGIDSIVKEFIEDEKTQVFNENKMNELLEKIQKHILYESSNCVLKKGTKVSYYEDDGWYDTDGELECFNDWGYIKNDLSIYF
jgi:hypothetical protein